MQISSPPELLMGQPYPSHALPPLMANAVFQASQNIQAPVAVIAIAALTTLSLATQNGFRVRRPTGTESPCGVNLLVFAVTGERKSACDRAFAPPIKAFQARHKERFTQKLAQYERSRQCWDAKKQALDRLLKRALKKGESITTIEAALKQLDSEKPMRVKSYKLVVENLTPQALLQALHKHHPVAAIVSSEGATALTSPAMQNYGTLNKFWDGDTVHVDRVSSESFSVDDPRFMISLMVQPKIGLPYLQRADNAARESGFLARCLVSYPPSTQGTRFLTGIPPGWALVDLYNARIAQLLEQTCPEDQNDKPNVILEMSQPAANVWFDFYNQVELNIAPGGYLSDIHDAASKILENVARVAALFHCLESRDKFVQLDNVQRAIEICTWHLEEFKRIFGEKPQVPQEVKDADTLGSWLAERCKLRNGVNAFLRSELLKFGPNALRKSDRLQLALDVLVSRFHVQLHLLDKKLWIVLNPAVFPVASQSPWIQ